MEFPRESEVQAGVDAYNRFVSKVWSFLQNELPARARAAGQSLVDNKRIKEIEVVKLDLASPPQLSLKGKLASPGLLEVLLHLPGSGAWTLRVRARVVIGGPFSRSGNRFEVTFRRLRIKAWLKIERQSANELRLVGSDVEVDPGKIKIDSSNFLLRIFAWLISFFINALKSRIKEMAKDALADALPNKEKVEAVEELHLADRSIEIPEPPPELASLETRVAAATEHLCTYHMPFGTVLNTLVPRDSPDADPQDSYCKVQDSAIWTGFFLAGEVYRFLVTGDDAAKTNIATALNGIEGLLGLDRPAEQRGGLLARLRVPLENEKVVGDIEKEMSDLRHEAWLFDSADGRNRYLGHITRDQYAGVFLGTGLASVLLEEGELRTQARGLVKRMAGYVMDRCFCPAEAANSVQGEDALTSVVYAGNPQHVLAILRLARYCAEQEDEQDTEYKQRLQEWYEALAPVWSILWLFEWLPALDPHSSYFKFNLSHATAHLLLLPELYDDAAERARLAQWLQVLRPLVRFHDYGWNGGFATASKFKLFKKYLYGVQERITYPQVPYFDENVTLIALNSMKAEVGLWDGLLADGEIGSRQLDDLGELILTLRDDPGLATDHKIVVMLHHHPFLFPDDSGYKKLREWYGHRLKDGDDLMGIIRGRVDVLLFGHEHRHIDFSVEFPDQRLTEEYKIPVILCNGKSTTPALRARVISLEPGKPPEVHDAPW